MGVRAAGRRGQRVVALSDGRDLLVTEEAMERIPISEGEAAEPERLQALADADRRVAAHDAALHLLSYRARSETEMRKRLALRGVDTSIAEGEIDRLRTAGLLDDEKFARAWVEDRKRLAPRGRRMLRYELLGRGIEPESVESAMSEVDDRATAVELARARARRISYGDYASFSTRVTGFLRRRGFDHDVAAEATRLAWAEVAGDTEPAAPRTPATDV